MSFAETGSVRQEVFRIGSDVVAANLPGLRSSIKERVGAGALYLVLDLSGVAMVDSAGIGLLIATHNTLRRAGGALEIMHASEEIRSLFQAMRMHQHFRISGEEPK